MAQRVIPPLLFLKSVKNLRRLLTMDNMHDDQTQDLDMLKGILQKVIDEMNDMETNRILPDGHPKKKMAVEATVAAEPSPMDDMGEEMPEEENGELDPAVLKELMDKAGQADESGALPEDQQDDLPPEVAAAVAARRKKPL
jgi:hypothetical protein